MSSIHLARLLLLFGLLAAGLTGFTGAAHAAQKPAEDPAVLEFKKYYKEYSREYARAGKDEKDRKTAAVTIREAILTLKGQESPQVIDAVLPAIRFGEPDIDSAVVTVLGSFKSRPPVDALLDAIAKEKSEQVQDVLLQAFELGRYPGSVETLSPLVSSGSWQVRRRAALALAALKDPAASAAIVPLCSDKEPAIRCVSLDALAALDASATPPSSNVVKPAIAALTDPVWQVRASAIHALGLVRRSEALDPLVAALAKEDGRLKVDLVATLELMTGFFYGQDVEKWQELATRAGGRFPIPSLEYVAEQRIRSKELKKPRTGAGAGDAPTQPRQGEWPNETVYHGVETPSRSIIFVIDVSGSMESLVVEKERFRDGNYPSMMRIDIVKTELIRTIQRLEPFVNFNVQSFATKVDWWKPKLQQASAANKAAACDWVGRLEAIGGSSKEDLARVGLVGSAGLDGGQTNTYGSLMSALGVPAKGSTDAGYTVPFDTLFFLSDGRPSTGDYVDTDDILREVKRQNDLRKVVIHTIAIGEFQKDFMKRLAEENGGIFVDLGR
jgi:hypothetical protein